MIKGNLFAGELRKTACLKGSRVFACLTCFSHNLKRPTLVANPAHGDSPHSSVPAAASALFDCGEMIGVRAHCAEGVQGKGGKKKKQKAFHILLPILFVLQAGSSSQPTHSRQLDPAVCCFQANSWGTCAAGQVLCTSIFGGLPTTDCILVSPLFEGEVFHGTQVRARKADAQGHPARLQGQVSLVASGTCHIGWTFLDAGC